MVRLCFGDTTGNNADTDFRYKLDRYSSTRIGAFQIIDQLLQVLDTVNVMVWWGTDQADTCGGVTSAGNGCGYFVAWEFSTFSWLCTLGHLDLKFVGIGEVVGSYTETTGCDLLDGRAHSVTIG